MFIKFNSTQTTFAGQKTDTAKEKEEMVAALFSLPNFDLTGRLVRAPAHPIGVTSLDVCELPAGYYYWEMTSRGKRVKSGKAVKIK